MFSCETQLNRSLSAPDVQQCTYENFEGHFKNNSKGLSIRRIYIQQCIEFNVPQKVKCHTYEKIYGTSASNGTNRNSSNKDICRSLTNLSVTPNSLINNLDVNSLPFMSGLKLNDEINSSIKDVIDKEVPMEIDDSCDNSLIKHDNILNANSEEIDTVSVKQRNHVPIRIHNKPLNNAVQRTQKENKYTFRKIQFLFSIALVPLLIYFTLINKRTVPPHLSDLDKLRTELKNDVYGQDECVNIILNSLQTSYVWKNKLKLLSFVGSSGVGKTFVSNILKNYFRSSTFELYSQEINKPNAQLKAIQNSKDDFTLLVLDGLKENNLIDVLNLVQLLPKTRFILVLAIFNIQYADEELNYTTRTEDIVKIRKSFDTSGIDYEMVEFRGFTMEDVGFWLDLQFKKNFVGNFLPCDLMKSSVMEKHNVKEKGFKGIQSKILVELDKLNNS